MTRAQTSEASKVQSGEVKFCFFFQLLGIPTHRRLEVIKVLKKWRKISRIRASYKSETPCSRPVTRMYYTEKLCRKTLQFNKRTHSLASRRHAQRKKRRKKEEEEEKSEQEFYRFFLPLQRAGDKFLLPEGTLERRKVTKED